jgi:hypothetical protein
MPIEAVAVMTHDNHESSGHGGRGWYSLLGPLPFDVKKAKCAGRHDHDLCSASPSATARGGHAVRVP